MNSFTTRRSTYFVIGIVAVLALAQAFLPGGLTPADVLHQALAWIGAAPQGSSTSSTPVNSGASISTDIAPSSSSAAAIATAARQATSSARSSASTSPNINAGTASAGRAGMPRDSHMILAYYVPYDPTSWQSLQAHADTIDIVAPQWVDIDGCGDVGSRDDQTVVAFARGKGLRIVPSLLTGSQELNHVLLDDTATSQHAIQQLVAYVVNERYDGLDLDMENISPADRQPYTAFVQRLSAALHAKGKLLTAAIPAKTFDATTGWAGAYQYSAIAPYMDLVTIMTYEYSSPEGQPGSTAPIDWVEKVIAYAASQFPPQKLLVGVAFYGYDWNVSSGQTARALRNPYADVLAKDFGTAIQLDQATKSATFSYTVKPGVTVPSDETLPPLDHQIVKYPLPACSVAIPTPTPRPTRTPRPTVNGQTHVVWIEDARAVTAHLQIVGKYGIAGIGAWRLGQEDPAVWPDFREWRSPGK